MRFNGGAYVAGQDGYRIHASGFNTAVTHRPALVVTADDPTDVVMAVDLARRTGRAVGVLNTGHGPSVPADGAVLIRTIRMNRVEVDPAARTARVDAGASWSDVIRAAARHGLAPLNGTSPHVGAIGYTLGGGVGPLGRRFGFAADHVRWLDVVTADGRLHHVNPTTEPELFWALRGAGANFGVVIAMEIDLFPVRTLLGGELCYGPDACEPILHAYTEWTRTVPDTMSSSIMVTRYPNDPALPTTLRGQHVTHIRLAYSGNDPREGRSWLDPLHQIATPILDTIRTMPYTDIGTIHHEPVDEPVPAYDRNILLRRLDARGVAVLAEHVGPAADAPFLTEIRAWRGALARPPAVANTVAGRDAAYSLLAISGPRREERTRRDRLLDAMAPWSNGMMYLNFTGVEDASPQLVARAYRASDFARLQEVKAAYDPTNMFRINFNILPQPGTASSKED